MKSKVEIDPKLPEEWAEFHVHELTPKLQFPNFSWAIISLTGLSKPTPTHQVNKTTANFLNQAKSPNNKVISTIATTVVHQAQCPKTCQWCYG